MRAHVATLDSDRREHGASHDGKVKPTATVIVGLLAGWFYGWLWMDPIVGILVSIIIARWSLGLPRDSGSVLLDAVPNHSTERSIRRTIGRGGDTLADLNLWRVGPGT